MFLFGGLVVCWWGVLVVSIFFPPQETLSKRKHPPIDDYKIINYNYTLLSRENYTLLYRGETMTEHVTSKQTGKKTTKRKPGAVRREAEKRGKARRKADGKAIVKAPSPRRKVDVTKAFDMHFSEKAMSYYEIAAYFDVEYETIRRTLAPYKKMMEKHAAGNENAKLYQEKKSMLLDAAELKMLTTCLDEGKIEDASLNNVAYTLNTIANMNRLEKGQSTANVSYQDMSRSLSEIQQARQQLVEQLNRLDENVQPVGIVEVEVVEVTN